ncbi:MAG: aminopeptidase P family protein [Pseudoclavibacter sp.]|nr:aminopeptidase P family protein [Pseudoclavibacter sp.]
MSSSESRTANRSTVPTAPAFQQRIGRDWAEREESVPEPHPGADTARAHREAISARHPGRRIVVPAGPYKQRSNDTNYPFRAHSAFAQLTGWGAASEPEAVLVLEPSEAGHQAVLHFRERAGRDSDEFYANPEIGEFWIGPRPSLAQVSALLGVATAHLDGFRLEVGAADTVLVREADPALAAELDRLRRRDGDEAALVAAHAEDAQLAQDLSELRLVKDAYETAELRRAVAATAAGFDDIVENLARAAAHERGERVIDGVFSARARLDGNEVGYETIAAAGEHACYLHWTRNDGPVRRGDLVLVDAGVEVESLFTADITRTLPVSGVFTEVQRRVYEAVLEAADAAFAVVRPGITFRTVHETAMRVIAQRTSEWGVTGVSVEESLAPEGQHHRRYMVHGTSHHLGIDVHDCAQARREMYLDGVLEPGMVFTIEPGLYFRGDDLTVPEELRGIGVRIEDDVLVTPEGAENLSAAIPRTVDEVEAWLRGERRAAG